MQYLCELTHKSQNIKSRLNTEKTLCYSELSGHTARPDIKKSKSHKLLSAF
ncbi:hypothetical protein GTD58_004768 [Salmonella enterica]|nr:hypothetical protein [Salmonella enterica subsp. enterica serovar Kentucky]EEG4307270.1 hypothetical protein [Salmonella enterica subsp. enterica serovar Kentucky]EEK8027496.1 hypothetical protein [Salmonella enterica subsp. enterica serovar Kentucky]